MNYTVRHRASPSFFFLEQYTFLLLKLFQIANKPIILLKNVKEVSMIIQKKVKTNSLVTAFDALLFKKQYIYHAIKVKKYINNVT